MVRAMICPSAAARRRTTFRWGGWARALFL